MERSFYYSSAGTQRGKLSGLCIAFVNKYIDGFAFHTKPFLRDNLFFISREKDPRLVVIKYFSSLFWGGILN